jgi:hypothetical protein
MIMCQYCARAEFHNGRHPTYRAASEHNRAVVASLRDHGEARPKRTDQTTQAIAKDPSLDTTVELRPLHLDSRNFGGREYAVVR